MKRKKVVIIDALKFYRIKFMELLKQKCNENNIDLVLIYNKDDKIPFNDAEIEWGIKIRNYKINILGKSLYFQPVFKHIKNADLIIVNQATKLLINYYLWFLNLLGVYKIAFWGHGKNFQNKNFFSISEFIKKIMTRSIAHFFAYNDLSRKIVEEIGLPKSRITVVNNTIDVESIIEECKKYDDKKLLEFKRKLGLVSENICIYVGGMYREKRISFLLKALKLVREKIKDFEFIFIGDGPDKDLILQANKEYNWVHYYGVKTENEKIPFMLISKLLLMPGLVGLVIIDAFTFGLPLVTTDCKIHSPEIDYLENGINGIMTENNLTDYTNAVIKLLENENERQKLVKGCKKSASKYTMENMVNNFFNGILSAINLK